jgi:hypothetical protein
MKNFYLKLVPFLSVVILHENILAQCGSPVANGSAGNMFTHIRNSTHPVAADKNLNSIVFIHRNNSNTFGGNTGQLRYDYSTNAGATWTVDQGILNPINTNLARYPNVTIYNPSLNINPANAYLGYVAATIDPTLSSWNGVVSGVSQFNGSGNTEFYNQPVISPQLIPHSVVKGAPGVFWAVDALFNGTNITGFTIYKGQWSGNNINWSNNYSVNPPFNLGYTGAAYVGDYNISFDPTGTIGWFSFLGHVSPGPAAYAYYPVLYKTTNGGTTWTGPFQVNLNQFSCITANMSGNNVASCNFEHDLTVDVNGNPHILTTVCNGNNQYSILYGSWHRMYDITQVNGVWAAYEIANVNAGRGTWGISPNTVFMDMAPQIARTADGSKLFFTWSDNSNYSLGTANLSPDLFSRAYDVVQNQWTQVKNFSSCNGAVAGKILFPHLAPEVLEPTANTFKLASVFAEFSVPNDPLQVTDFHFLNNVTYSASEFTITPPSATITIPQSNPLLLCTNSTVNISVSGNPGQVLWSTGSTTNVLPVSNPTISTYSVVAQQGCYVGTASISVVNLTMSPSAPGTGVCPGNTISLSVNGNANSYTWHPGNVSGTLVTVSPSVNPVYTVIAGGSGNCINASTVSINLLALPTLTITGTDTICMGFQVQKNVSGAASYSWSDGSSGNMITVSPTINTVYTVTGTAVNSCTNTQTTSVFVNPLPTVSAVSSESVICSGVSITLSASGAQTYSWTGIGSTESISATPSISTIYSVSGTNIQQCSNSTTLSIIVNPLPTVSIVSSRTLHCKGEKSFTLSANGASTYTWTHNGVTTKTILINPITTITYSLTGKDSEGCMGESVYTQSVSNCTGLIGTDPEAESFLIYPNPNNGVFFIKALKKINLEVINNLGQVVYSATLNQEINKIQLQEIPSGIYFIREGGKNTTAVKIVVTK